MTDIVNLAVKMPTDSLLKGAKALDNVDKAGAKAEKALKGVSVKSTTANDKLGKVGSTAKSTSSSISGLAGNVGKLSALFAGISVASLASNMTQMAFSFDDAMNTVQSKLLITTDQMGVLNEQAKTLGKTTSFSATQAGEGMSFLAQAGLNANQILTATPKVLDLAAAAGLGLAESADIATNVLGAFKMPVTELGGVVDILALTSAKANTSVQELAQALKQAAPIAKGYGVSVADTSAVLGVFANNGFKGEQAGMAFKNMMLNLAAPAGDGKKALEKLNLTTSDFFKTLSNGELEFSGTSEMLKTLAANGATATDMIRIFGREAGPAIATLVGEGENLDKLAENIVKTGAASEMAALRMQGLVGVTKITSSTWEALNLSLADAGGRDLAISGMETLISVMQGGIGIAEEFKLASEELSIAWAKSSNEMAQYSDNSTSEIGKVFDSLLFNLSTSMAEIKGRWQDTAAFLPLVFNASMSAIGNTMDGFYYSSVAVFQRFGASVDEVLAGILGGGRYMYGGLINLGGKAIGQMIAQLATLVKAASSLGNIPGLGDFGESLSGKSESLAKLSASFKSAGRDLMETDGEYQKSLLSNAQTAKALASSYEAMANNSYATAKGVIAAAKDIKKGIIEDREVRAIAKSYQQLSDAMNMGASTGKTVVNPTAPTYSNAPASSSVGSKSTSKKTTISDTARADAQLIDSLRTAQEKYNLAIADYDNRLAKGRISQETYNRAVAAANKELVDATKKAEKLTTATKTQTDAERYRNKLIEQSLTLAEKRDKEIARVNSTNVSDDVKAKNIARINAEYEKQTATVWKMGDANKAENEAARGRAQVVAETRTAYEKLNIAIDDLYKIEGLDDDTKKRKLIQLQDEYKKTELSIYKNSQAYKDKEEADKKASEQSKKTIAETKRVRTIFDEARGKIELFKTRLNGSKEASDAYALSVSEKLNPAKAEELRLLNATGEELEKDYNRKVKYTKTITDLAEQQAILNASLAGGKDAGRVKQITTESGISEDEAKTQLTDETSISNTQKLIDLRDNAKTLIEEQNKQQKLANILATEGADAVRLQELAAEGLNEKQAKLYLSQEKIMEQTELQTAKTKEWQDSFMIAIQSGKDGIIDYFETMVKQALWAQAQTMLFGSSGDTGAAATSGIIGGLLGFASGGYTGNGGVGEVAGVTHGKEFVVNANATAKNRATLEAMNAGGSTMDTGGNDNSINFAPNITITGDGSQITQADISKVLSQQMEKIPAIINRQLSKGGSTSRLAGMRT